MAISGYMNAKNKKGFQLVEEELTKKADLLAGDAIMNYRTVASFANEDKIVKDYKNFLQISQNKAIKKAVIIGFTYGLAQFIMYATQAIIFYIGGEFMQLFNEDPTNMFISIFAIMFAAIQAGQA